MEENFLEKLVEYFNTTPKEKILADWKKSEKYDQIGPTMQEFEENFTIEIPILKELKKSNVFDNTSEEYKKSKEFAILTWKAPLFSREEIQELLKKLNSEVSIKTNIYRFEQELRKLSLEKATSIKNNENSSDSLKRRLERLKKRLNDLKIEHVGNETTYTYWGGYDMGYLKGTINEIENFLDTIE